MEKVKVFKVHPDAVVPSNQTGEAAGYDLHCVEDFKLAPGRRIAVRTGLVIQPPEGYHIEILARSGLAYKYGICLTNNVGLIDRDFCGPEDEIKVLLTYIPSMARGPMYGAIMDNFKMLEFKKGDRIAQFVFRHTHRLEFEEVGAAPGDDRGGLGSTGV